MFNPEDIIDLAEQLRAARFNIGLQQHIAAQDLMIALVASGRLPEDPRKWKTLLAPIFCSNQTEQEQFTQHFDSWLSRRPKLVELAAQAEQADQPSPTETIQPKKQLTVTDLLSWIRLHPAWSVAAVLLLSALLAGVLMFKLDRKLEGQVFSQTEGNPLPGAEVSFLNQTATTDKDGKFLIAYQIRVYEWLSTLKFEPAQITELKHYSVFPVVTVQHPSQISAVLEKREDLKPGGNPIQPISEPVAQTPPPVAPPEQRSAIRRSLLIALIPLALFALWMLWRWIRKRMVLRKLEVSGTPRIHRLSFKREDVPLFSSSPFRRAAQELRRHRHVEHHELDVPATVGATIRKGYFTPSYSKRRSLPEYLLLIDRASAHDGQARVAEELALRLEADGVFVDRFYFQGDARTCRAPEPPLSPVYTLHELSARYPDHRLLVFSDAEGFFDPFTAEPGRWLEQFDYWQHRVLLTPEAPGEWGYREFTLAEQHGFVLIPAKITGLAALGELLNIGLMQEPAIDEESPFPAVAADNARRMLDSRAPKPEVIEQLCDQARAYLGTEGWLWLTACAVYPQVKWEITLYLGGRLFGESAERSTTGDTGSTGENGKGKGIFSVFQKLFALSSDQASKSFSKNYPRVPRAPRGSNLPQDNDWAESVLRLVRLPWFRFGRMPDWLRERLIADFQPEQEAKIRKIIADLLRKVLTNPLEPLTLEFAEAEKPTERWKAFRQSISDRFNKWRQRRELYRLLQAQPEESPLRDFVFLSFLAGQSRKRLTVKPPDLLRRILFNEGVAALGFRPLTVGVVAGILLLTLLSLIWPELPQPPKPDGLLAGSSPTPTVDASSQPVTTQSPRATRTQGTIPVNCRSEITASDYYVIRLVTVVSITGKKLDFDYSDYVGMIYSPDELNAIHNSLRKFWVTSRNEEITVTDCVSVVSPNICMNDIGVPKCLDVIVKEATITPAFNYWLIVQKYRDGKPYQLPFRLTGELIFENDYHVQLNVGAARTGFLYIVNESPQPVNGLPEYVTLFPSPTANNGKAELVANQQIAIPPAGDGFFLDKDYGTEKLWLVWSSKSLPELEAVKSLVSPKDKGQISDPAQIRALRDLIAKYRAIPARVGKDEANKLTKISGSSDVIVHLIRLEHH